VHAASHHSRSHVSVCLSACVCQAAQQPGPCQTSAPVSVCVCGGGKSSRITRKTVIVRDLVFFLRRRGLSLMLSTHAWQALH
jgi:hypothetical protein